MILSDRDLRTELAGGGLTITPPPDDWDIQPASIELHLGTNFTPIDGWPAFEADLYWLRPGGFLLGHTTETVGIGEHLVGQLNGKSTLGRLGLAIHITAGFIDPGFRGQITLELFNSSADDIELAAGMAIGQLVVMRLSSPAERPYGHPDLGSHYQGQQGAVSAHSSRPVVYRES